MANGVEIALVSSEFIPLVGDHQILCYSATLFIQRAQAVLARGYAFGESRSVCGVHWASDIEAGRLIGAAAVARLHGDALFNAQLSAARLEVNEARAKGQRSTLDCAGEAIVLAVKRP